MGAGTRSAVIRRSLVVLAVAAVWALFSAAPAAAYIDPASGSYLLQLLVGVAVGVGAVVLLPFRKVAGRLRRRREPALPQPPAAGPGEAPTSADLEG